MASTTKILTGIIALELKEKQNNPEITITDKMVPVEGSSMYLQVGNVLTLDGLIKGMLSVSGNDAAHSIALALGGDLKNFAKIMNEKAEQIGMKNSNFVTPSGLDDENHYSTAFDMALLGSYAMKNQEFCDIVSKKKLEVPFILPAETRTYRNHNKLLKSCEGCLGIKTGFTRKSGRCLVSCVERDKIRLIAVTLNAGDDWNDHKKLYNHAFSITELKELESINSLKIPIVGASQENITAVQENSVKITLEKNKDLKIKKQIQVPRFLYSPVKKNQVIGKVNYILNDKVISSANIISQEDCEFLNKKENIFKKIFSFFFKK